MLALALAALVACPAPQDTATVDAPAYVDQAYGVSLPRPFDDWVFEPGTGQRTTTVIFHPRGAPLGAQIWGALVLTTFPAPIMLARVVDQRVRGTWRRLLGDGFAVLARDSLAVAGRPAVRVLLTGAIRGVGLDVEEYAVARDSDLVLLQFRYPHGVPRDSLAAGYARAVRGLAIAAAAPPLETRAVPASFADSVPTERIVPRSPWQAVGYDASVRYEAPAARADFVVRITLVNDGTGAADSVPLWLWPGFVLDSVRGETSALAPRGSASVSWLRLSAEAGIAGRAVLTCFYHLRPGPGGLPASVMGMAAQGAYVVGEWLPATQATFDSVGQFARAARPELTLRFDLPEGWRAVAPGRLVADARFRGRRRMTWRSGEVATAAAAFALGPYRQIDGSPGDIPVSLLLTPRDSLSAEATDALVGTARAAWRFCSRAFGRLPVGEVAIATADVPTPRGFAGLVLLDHRTAALFALADSSAGGAPREAADAVFREVARTWWGSSVAAVGVGSGWMTESFPAWTVIAARGILQGDSVRQQLVQDVEAAWRADVTARSDAPLAPIAPRGPRADLLQTKGVAAIEAMRRALGEARFRAVVLSLAREHRNTWLTLDDVLEAAGPDVGTVLRTFLY